MTSPSDPVLAQLLARLDQLEGSIRFLAGGMANLAAFASAHDDRMLSVENRMTAVETHLEERYRIEKHLAPPTVRPGDTGIP